MAVDVKIGSEVHHTVRDWYHHTREERLAADKLDFLRAYADWLAAQPAHVLPLYHHDARTREAVEAGVLDRSFLGTQYPKQAPAHDWWKRIDLRWLDEVAGLVPMRPAKRAQPTERQPPAMSALVYGNLFKC